MHLSVGPRFDVDILLSSSAPIFFSCFLWTMCYSLWYFGYFLGSLFMTWSSPRCHLRSYYLVCIEDHLFIVVIAPILNKKLEFIFRSDTSDRMCVYSWYKYYTKELNYKNVTQTALFFAYKNVTPSVWIFLNKNLTKSALFFAYYNVTQSALVFASKLSPPLRKFHKSNEKLCNAKCPGFCI